MKRLGIRGQMVFHSAWILTALGAAVTLYSVSQLHDLLYREMVQRIEAQALNWIEANTAQIILSGDPHILDRLVRELKTREGIAYVILVDAQRRQKAAIGMRQGLTKLATSGPDPNSPMCWREMRDATGRQYLELTAAISTAGTGMSPDLGTLFGAAARDPTWGELRIGVDRQEFARGVNALVRKNVLLAAALISLAIALSVVFAKHMVTPITLMATAANQIAAGNLSERVRRGNSLRNEVGDLVRNFNRMALRLEDNREEMNLLHSRLEDKVLERTHELEQANQKLKKLDQLKSNFLSTVSHELRTPLTSIKAYAEILLDARHLDPETGQRFLGIIDKEADRMSRMIADLLNLEKIESGTTSWAMNDCDLREIIRAAAAVLAPSAADKCISLRLHVPAPQPVWADPDRIQEVITNLIGNGIKFCSRGGHIEVRLQRSCVSGPGRLPGEYIRVEVTDDGPGVQPGERDQVFEKFYQGARNGSNGSGSGLGLAISRKSCCTTEARFGSIPNPAPAAASTSRCRCSRRVATSKRALRQSERRHEVPKTVLVCDDEPYILESVGYVVREEGYSVLTADNGDDALSLARSESPDVVILDISMPRRDGIAVCRELKAGAATRSIYIIILTAKGQERDMQESYRCGADEFMTKPFSPRNLRKRLHEVLD